MMLFNRAEMFNKKAAHPKSKADEIVRLLEIEKGYTVADIGSGGGYFAIRLAESTGQSGRVYAVDTNPKLLAYVEKAAKERRITNIITILVEGQVPELPHSCCDLIFMRNVFHHLDDPAVYFKALREFIKPEGRIAIIEYKKSTALSFHTLMKHYTDEDFIWDNMIKTGYEPVKRYDLLPEQSFNIFKRERMMIV